MSDITKPFDVAAAAEAGRAPRPSLRARLRNAPAWAVLAILLLLSGPPLVIVLTMSFQTGILTRNTEWSLANYVEVLNELAAGGPVVNTLVFAIGSAVVALALGGALAFLTERTDTPLRRMGYLGAITVVAIPAPVYAFAWFLVFGRQGPINYPLGLVAEWLGVEPPTIAITNLAGMIFVEGLSFSALAFFLLAGPMRSIDRSLEEAALMSGARNRHIFWRITGPLMLPGVLAVLILNFIRGMEAFAVPAMIGAPGRVSVLTTEIYYAVAQRQPPQYGIAAAHGTMLVLFVVALLLVYTSITAQASRFATISGKGFKPRLIELGSKRRIFGACLVAYFVIAVIVPLVMLLFASIQSFYGGMLFGKLTFKHYAELFNYRQVAESFWNSFVVGSVSSFAIMLLTVIAAWMAIRGTGRIRQVFDFAASLPLALPGTVLGLALLAMFVRLPLPVYGTLAAIVVAATIRFLPYGFRYAHAGLLQVHPELEEAGLMSGASRLQVSLRIVLPLVIMPVVAGFLYIFLISARELEASALLVTSRSPVIAPLLIDLYQNGSIPPLAAFSTVLVIVYGLIAYVFYHVAKRYGLSF